MKPETPFPEIGSSTDSKEVPWQDAVVWFERGADGHRIYEWLRKSDINRVSWTSGVLSIEIAPDSFLQKDFSYFILQSPFVAVGKNITIS